MTVTEIIHERPGLQRVKVADGPATSFAYALTQVIGDVSVGDDVIVNTTAVDLNLGTGGEHVVHWNLSRDSWATPGAGHILKLRYTSMQTDTGVTEEQPDYVAPSSLDGMPVIACLLHSQMPVVAATIKSLNPELNVVYVMTDQASLPLAISNVAFASRQSGLLDATITAGQAFGGDHEAVNVTSALGIAKSLGADVVIVAEGPGVVGTASPTGFGALEMTSVLDQATQYGGFAILALRWSDADSRPRHKGVSHHNLSVLERAILPVNIAVPVPGETVPLDRHRITEVEVPDIATILSNLDFSVTTMGRSVENDPGFYRFSAAAGVLAANQAARI